MQQSAIQNSLMIAVTIGLTWLRGSGGWGPLLAGAPASEWASEVTMALLYGVLLSILTVGGMVVGGSDDGNRFLPHFWGVLAVAIVVPIVTLAFFALGQDARQTGVDIVFSIGILGALAYIAVRAR